MRLILGDCLDVLKTLEDGSVDAVVTDPPAGISLMGSKWDSDKGGMEPWVGWLANVLAECLRVSRPGSFAVVWALPRTSYWTGLALHNAGWSVKDCITHCYSSGFPKNSGALKPASEMWFVAKKQGTGGLRTRESLIGDGGRHPANLVFSHNEDCIKVGNTLLPGRAMNRYTDGPKPFGGGVGHPHESTVMPDELCEVWDCVPGCTVDELNSQAGELASRFFLVSKPSRDEREAGLEPGTSKKNTHISVKSIALMRHLVSLVAAPEETVLDPFAGSGSTGIAALLEESNFIGIEQNESYMEIAQARIAFWQQHGEDGLRIVAERDRKLREGDASRREHEEAGQLNLL